MNVKTSAINILSDHDTASIAVYLEEDLKRTQRVDFDIFAEAVFGLSPDTMKAWSLRIREQNWLEDTTVEQGLREYCSASVETDRYIPLAAAVNRIIELARGSLPGIPDTYPIDDICLKRNDPIFIQTIPEHGPLGAKRKPDLVMIRGVRAHLLDRPTAGPKKSAPGIRWSHNITSWELKAKATMLARFIKVLKDRQLKDREASVEIDTALAPLSTRRKRRSADDAEDGTREPTPPECIASSDSAPIGVNGVKKEAKIQAGSYALETLACSYGTRLFCFNVVMDDDRIYLWYYDACGTVCTNSSISLIDDFEKAAALIAGIASCAPERLGALPSFLQPPLSIPYDTSWPPETLKDHILRLDGAEGKQVSITLKEPVFTQYSLIGRRTFVYTMEPNSDVSDQEMIVKLSYQVNTRAREQDLVAIARNAGVQHLPQIHYSSDLWKMSDGVRSIFHKQGGIEYEDRTLRVIVYSKYFPLQSLVPKQPECIRDMAVQMIDCLHDLKEKANILHRDISINNVMYELREGVPHFVLIDYDMAIILTTKDGKPRKQTSKYREGTLPFMAIDLLLNAANPWRDPVHHVLRHDYESVFWLSVWSSAVLIEPKTEEEEQAKERNVGRVRAWETLDFESIACNKESIRKKPLEHSNIVLIGQAASLESWYMQWSSLWSAVDTALNNALFAVTKARLHGLPPPTFDSETVGGLLTRDSILAILNGDSSAAPEPPSELQPDLPDTRDEGLGRTTTLLAHIFPDKKEARAKRAAARRTAAEKKPATAKGGRNAPTTTKRKAVSRKVEKVTRTPPPTSPPKRKQKPSTVAKGKTVKAAKKTTVKKAATADKTKVKAATAKSVRGTRGADPANTTTEKTTKGRPLSKDAEGGDPEAIGDVVQHGYALRSRKTAAAPARKATPPRVVRKASPVSSGGRRKKPSTPVKAVAVKAAAKRTAVKKAATRAPPKKAAASQGVRTRAATRKTATDKAVAAAEIAASTKTAATKKAKAKTAKTESKKDQESAPNDITTTPDEPAILHPLEVDDNDIRRRLRPRKRT